MKQMYGYLLLAPLILYGKDLAVCAGSPWWTHFTYMFGHAGWIHYALNGIAWLLMRRIVTPARTVTAVLVAALLPETHIPVLGWSVVLYYYMGLCLAAMTKSAKLRILAIVAAGFFVPWIAAWHHAGMLFAGWMIRKVEMKWERTMY